jgi:Tfp pilus assembly protein FimT
MFPLGKKRIPEKKNEPGFSVIELLLVVAFALVMAAISIPAVRSTIASYQLDGAVDTVSGAIQSTRYQAIMHGYPYQVDIDSTANQYTILSEAPPANAFTAVGSALLISPTPVVIGVGTASSSVSGHLILQFKANGSISIVSGQAAPINFTIAYNGTTKTITVSNYGSITVQ